MRFKEFLKEDKEFDFEKFKVDCAYVLDRLDGEHFLFHGSQDSPETFDIRTWHERSEPRDTDPNQHKVMNKFLKGKFGAEARNWLFTTSDFHDANYYANDYPVAIFPIGKFDWICCLDPETRDMTNFIALINRDYMSANQKNPTGLTFGEIKMKAIYDATAKLNKMEWRYDNDLDKCLKSKNEIMIRCDKFYAVNTLNSSASSPILHKIKLYLKERK
jgi:hypothetical protein